MAVVKALDYDAGSGAATVERELEGGLTELLRVRLPALLTIQTGINEPRYANLRAIKQAKEKPLELLGPGELESTGLPWKRQRARGRARLPRPRRRRRRDAERLGVRRRAPNRGHRQGEDDRMSGVLVIAESRKESCARSPAS